MASWPHPAAAGAPVNVEHWSNAQEMGNAAAANLLREPHERQAYTPVPTFWSDQYGVKIKSAGFLAHADRYEVTHEDADKPSLAEAYRGEELVGVVAFNRPRAVLDYQRGLAAKLLCVDGRRRESASPRCGRNYATRTSAGEKSGPAIAHPPHTVSFATSRMRAAPLTCGP